MNIIKRFKRLKKNINDFIKIFFSLDIYYDEKDIYNELLVDLIIGFFGKNGKMKGNIVRWKMYFRKYCLLFF